jgi:hypothetical protein
MSLVPDSRLGKIQFYEAHIGPWSTNATSIGLEDEATSALASLITAARSAYDAAEAARLAAKAATVNFYDKVRAMHSGPGAGADMIETIRNFARTTNNANVYVLAQIPPPATPGTTPPPGTPFDFRVELLQNGALVLKWKCNNPSGTMGTIYEVKRAIGAGGSTLNFVGASGIKSFIDETLPTGGAPVTYQITAVRSTSRGNPAQFLVNFGMAGQSITVASISDTDAVKIAA